MVERRPGKPLFRELGGERGFYTFGVATPALLSRVPPVIEMTFRTRAVIRHGSRFVTHALNFLSIRTRGDSTSDDETCDFGGSPDSGAGRAGGRECRSFHDL